MSKIMYGSSICCLLQGFTVEHYPTHGYTKLTATKVYQPVQVTFLLPNINESMAACMLSFVATHTLVFSACNFLNITKIEDL